MNKKSVYLKRLESAKKLKERVRKMYADGISQADIGRRLGVTRSRVNQIIKEDHAAY